MSLLRKSKQYWLIVQVFDDNTAEPKPLIEASQRIELPEEPPVGRLFESCQEIIGRVHEVTIDISEGKVIPKIYLHHNLPRDPGDFEIYRERLEADGFEIDIYVQPKRKAKAA